jgi:hypothetical protein
MVGFRCIIVNTLHKGDNNDDDDDNNYYYYYYSGVRATSSSLRYPPVLRSPQITPLLGS